MRSLGKFLLWAAVFIIVVGGVLRLTILNIWVVPSDDKLMAASVAPSLAPGDVVVLFHGGNRGFGDLVRCVDPQEPLRYVIGRVAAEGGDTIEVDRTKVIINGKPAGTEHSCGIATIEDPTTGATVELHCSVEDLGGRGHRRASRPTDIVTSPLKYTVQPDTFFLVSDNRAYPLDSRIYGAVPAASCDSQFIFRIWGDSGYSDESWRFTWVH